MSSIKEHPRGGGFVPPGHDGAGGPPGRGPRTDGVHSGPIVPNNPSPPATTTPNAPQTPTGPGTAPPPQPGGPAVESPRDGFHDVPAYDSPVADAGLRGQGSTYKRPVADLAPNLQKVRDLPDVGDRFASDYQMVAREIVDVPEAQSPERAQRAFEYFSKYAERFVEIATKPKEEVPPETKSEELPSDSLPQTELPQEPTDRTQKDPRKLPTDPKKTPEGELPPGELPGDGEVLVKLPKGETPETTKKSRLERLQELPLKGEGETSTRDSKSRELWFGGKEVRRASEESPLQNRKDQPPPRAYSEGEKKTSAQEFVSTLADLGFDRLHDEKTGQNGLEKAYELLMSRSLKELQQKAQQTRMTAENWPPPQAQPRSEELVKENAPQKKAANEFTGTPLQYKDIGESSSKLSHRQAQDPLKDGIELRVNTLAAETGKAIINPRDQQELRNEGMQNEADPRLRSRGKLGRNTLWNVLHTFRKEGADSAVEESKWDRLTFGAFLMLIAIALIVVVLVSM